MLHLSFLPATCSHSGRELDGLQTQHLRFSVRGTGGWADSPDLVPGSRLWSVSCWNLALPIHTDHLWESTARLEGKTRKQVCSTQRADTCERAGPSGVTDISSAQAVRSLITWALISRFLQLLGLLEHLPHILSMPAFLVFHDHCFSYNISYNLEKLF